MNFSTLFARADEETLQSLIGRPALRLLHILDPQLLRSTRLRELVLALSTPAQLLLSTDSRRMLLDLLPIQSARALADYLGLVVEGDVYEALRSFSVRPGSVRARSPCA